MGFSGPQYIYSIIFGSFCKQLQFDGKIKTKNRTLNSS